MKKISRSFVAVFVLGLALVTTATVWALRPELRLDATTPDGQITELTAQLLEHGQFSHQPIDNAMATKFLDQYIDSLDGSHELFLQSDIAECHRFLPHRANATVDKGDTRPAHVIFDRYLQRLAERAAFVTKALATEKFDFSGHDRFLADREKAPAPRDETEAHALWHERLQAEVLQEKLVGKKPDQFVQTLTHRSQRQVEMMKKLSGASVLELYLNGLAHAYDPHSDYMGREQLESFNIAMNLSLAGIGATLQADDGICKIMELVPGGPALASGKLKAGDKIVGVSQGPGKEMVDLVDLPLPQAVELIRGPKGTEVTLTIIPAGAMDDVRKTVTIQRDQIHLESQEAKARIVDFPTKDARTMRLGVIDLPAFYADEDGKGQSATADVAQLVNKLEEQNVRGIILDLRRNGGGSLAEAISLTGLFIPSGPIVQTRDLAGQVKVGSDDDGHALYTGPLIVLTSRFSASASEILAGALQDYGRARIVGDTSTFGKGTVQTMLSLKSIMERNGISPASDPGALKLTVSKFYRPGGSSTQLRGVRADIVLPSFTDTPEISEAGMKNPMPWDSVPAASYPHFDLVKPYVAQLSDASRARIASDRDFSWWDQDLARVEKQRADKSVSLNEAERRQELDATKARNKARAAERLAHPTALPKSDEITVENADQPGLPAPLEPAKLKAQNTAANAQDGDDEIAAAPAEDVLLRETEHILTDYVNLVPAAPYAPVVTQR